MKGVLCLALLCCFVGGSFGVGCPSKCSGFIECACIPGLEVVKMRVTSDKYTDFKISGKNVALNCYNANLKQSYKKIKLEEGDLERVCIAQACSLQLTKGETYYVVGNKFAKTLMVPQPNGVKKLKTNASDKQEEFVRRMSRKGAEAACDEEGH